MTIIIETPAPPVRERLVLVPLDACNEVREDDPRTKLGAKVGLTVLGTHARDATPADLERAGYAPRAMLTPDERTLCAESELDAEREETRHLRIRLSEQHERAEKAERERDEARRLHSAAEAQVACRSELRAERSEWATRAYAAERERDTLRAELARLTAPAEGEPTDEELERVEDRGIGTDDAGFAEYASGRRALYRLGVAHERARQPAQERATDEELFALAAKIDRESSFGGLQLIRAIVRAVAARVRGERCLVAQAVARSWYLYLCPQKNEPSKWDIETGRVIAGRSDGGAILHGVPAADVPANLARLLGEVSRG